MKEFNLSEKIMKYPDSSEIDTRDVKEFIKRLKINIVENDIFVATEIFNEIDKLAGDDLI